MARGNITYAQKAKQIVNKYKKRLGENLDGMDKPSKESMNKELENLKQDQELDRAIMYKDMNKGMSMDEFAYGGLMPKLGNGGPEYNPYFAAANPYTYMGYPEDPNQNLPVTPNDLSYGVPNSASNPTAINPALVRPDPRYNSAARPTQIAPAVVYGHKKPFDPSTLPNVNVYNKPVVKPSGYLFNRPPAVDLSRPQSTNPSNVPSFINPNVPINTGAPSQAVSTPTGSATTTPTRTGGKKVAPISAKNSLAQMFAGVENTNRYNADQYHAAQTAQEQADYNPTGWNSATKSYENIKNPNKPMDYSGIPSDGKPYRTQVSPLGLAPALIGYGLNRRAIKDMSKIKYTPQNVSPERISLASARSAIEARRREQNNMMKGVGMNLSGSQRYANTLAGVSEADRGSGEQTNATYLEEATRNADANNRAKMYNAESSTRAQEANNQMRMNTIQARLANNQGLVAAGSGYMRDVAQARQWDSMSELMSDNYRAETPNSYRNKPLYTRAADYILGKGKDKRYVTKRFDKVSS